MTQRADIQRWGDFFAPVRCAVDAIRRAQDRCPLVEQDEVDWTYAVKQLEQGMKFLGMAYDLARKFRDQKRTEKTSAQGREPEPPRPDKPNPVDPSPKGTREGGAGPL